VAALASSLVMIALAAGAQLLGAQDTTRRSGVPNNAVDSAEIVAFANLFGESLGKADSATIVSLFTSDAMVMIGGGALRPVKEYRRITLPGDIRFAMAMPRTKTTINRVEVHSDDAWISLTHVVEGTVEGRKSFAFVDELMVLRKVGGGWLIAVLHRSTR
jgi:hypothetical protein